MNWKHHEPPANVAWEVLQEIRWVLKDVTGVEAPPAAKKTIDFEGRLVKAPFAGVSRIARKPLVI